MNCRRRWSEDEGATTFVQKLRTDFCIWTTCVPDQLSTLAWRNVRIDRRRTSTVPDAPRLLAMGPSARQRFAGNIPLASRRDGLFSRPCASIGEPARQARRGGFQCGPGIEAGDRARPPSTGAQLGATWPCAAGSRPRRCAACPGSRPIAATFHAELAGGQCGCRPCRWHPSPYGIAGAR